MGSCQRQSLKSFSGPSRTPPLAARKAIPPPPTTQTARKTLRRIQSSRQNRTEETPRGRPRPLRTGPPPQTTRRTRRARPQTPPPPPPTEHPQSPPNTNHPPNNPSNPSGFPAPVDPGTDTPPDNNTGDKTAAPPAPAVSRQEAQSLLTAYLAQQGRTLTLVPLDSSPNQGYWRFSGRDANGNAVTFLMVSCSTGQIHEIPVPPSSTGPGLG